MGKTSNYHCSYCPLSTTSSTSLRLHVAQKHHCYACNQIKRNPSPTGHICVKQVGAGIVKKQIVPTKFRIIESALDGTFQSYTLVLSERFVSLDQLFRAYNSDFVGLLTNCIITSKSIKSRIVFSVLLHNNFTGDEMTHYLSSHTEILLNKQQIKSFLRRATAELIHNLNIFVSNGSNWSIVAVEEMSVKVLKYRPFRVGHTISLPLCYRQKRGLLNIRCRNNLCFAYCAIARYLEIKTKREGEVVKKYVQFMDENYDNLTKEFKTIDFSMLDLVDGIELGDIANFVQNPKNSDFSVNVYIHDNEDCCIYPHLIVEQERKLHMDLMLIRDEAEDISHFILIQDFNLFMKNKNCHKRFFCKRCLQSFLTEDILKSHHEVCSLFPAQRLVFPENPVITYKIGEDSIPQPGFVVADFESHLRTLVESYYRKKGILGKHVALSCGYAYIVNGQVEHKRYWDGPDADRIFCQEMMDLATGHLERMSAYRNVMKLSRSDWMDYITCRKCCICKELLHCDDDIEEVDMREMYEAAEAEEDKSFDFENSQLVYNPQRKYKKHETVRHHYHGSVNLGEVGGSLFEPARFLGGAHSGCNLQLKSRRALTVVFHNLQFDGSFVIKGLTKLGIKNIKILGRTSERFLVIEVPGKIKFVDSLQMLPFKLSKLISVLKQDHSRFKCTRQMLPGLSTAQYDLMITKQAMCYDLISPETIDDPMDELPEHKHFFSKLSNSNVSVSDHKIASQIYKMYQCKSLRDWLKLYCQLDVGCLADIMMTHRENCLKLYSLDPLNFVSLSSASFKAALSSSKVAIERVSDPDLYLAVKQSIRGGLVGCPRRYSVANYRDLPSYDPSKPERAICQLDVNSLYGNMMQMPLCIGGYRKLSESDCSTFDILKIDPNGPKGYLLCVDISVEESMHSYFSDLPMCPERIKIPRSEASEFQNDLMGNLPKLASAFDKTQYLLTLYPKSKYVDYIHSLQVAVKAGYKITKYHYIYEFDQAPFLQEWVTANLDRRAKTNSEVMSLIIKLFVNSVYGRFGLDKHKFRDFLLVQDHVTAERHIKKPNFQSFRILDENLVMVELKKTKVVLDNNLIIAGQILSRGRAYFYDVFYAIKRQLQDRNFNICYYDTDGAIVAWDTKDYLADLKSLKFEGKPLVDMSFLPDEHRFAQYRNLEHMNKPGMIKSETKQNRITRVVALKKKMYSAELEDGESKMKAKGVPNCFMANFASFEMYKRILFESCTQPITIHALRSIKLQIYHIEQLRMAFTPICDSRWLMPGPEFLSLPFGHVDLTEGDHESVLEE